jgi:hypothetical protein
MGCGLCKAEEKIRVVVSAQLPTAPKTPAAVLSLSTHNPERVKLFTVSEERSSLEESVRVLRMGPRSQSFGASSHASGLPKHISGGTAKE